LVKSTIFTSTSIIIGLIILLIFFFRVIFLWYWKVNFQVDLSTKSNSLLESILHSSKISKKDTSTEKPIKNIIKPEIESEVEEINKLLDDKIGELISILKDDQMIIEIKNNKELKVVQKSRYEMDKDLHLSHKYNVIYLNNL